MCLKDVMEQQRQVIVLYYSPDNFRYTFHVTGIFETDRDILKRINSKYKYAIGLQSIEKENLFIDIEDFSTIQFTHVRQSFIGEDIIIKPDTVLHPIFFNGILYMCSNIRDECIAWVEDKCKLLYLRSCNMYHKFYDILSDKIILIDG